MNKEININIDQETLDLAQGAIAQRLHIWKNTVRQFTGENMEDATIAEEGIDLEDARRMVAMYERAEDNLARAMRHRTMYQGMRRKVHTVTKVWMECNQASVPADLSRALGTSIDMYQQEAEQEASKTTAAA